MLERIFPRSVLIFLGAFSGAAFLIGLIGALLRGDGAGSVFLSALEAALLAFVETWGLAGSAQGALLHLVNFSWGNHVVGETRTDAHRYQSGFAVQSGFAFTQGAVMSSNTSPKGAPLYNHENTHVFQNRLFG